MTDIPNPFNSAPTREVWEGYSHGRPEEGDSAVTDPLAFMDVGAYFAARLAGHVDPQLCGVPQRTDNLIQLAKEIVASPILKAAMNVCSVAHCLEGDTAPAYYGQTITEQDGAVEEFRLALTQNKRQRLDGLPAPLVLRRMLGPVPPSVLLNTKRLLFRFSTDGDVRLSFVMTLREAPSEAEGEDNEASKIDGLGPLSYEAVTARLTFTTEAGTPLLDREISLGVQAPQPAVEQLVGALRAVLFMLDQTKAAQLLADEQEGRLYQKPVITPKEPLT